jgi:hypothetical protein
VIDGMPPINGSDASSLAAEDKLHEELASARAILEGLASALKLDAGAAFAEPTLRAAALVKRKDAGAWARYKTALQRAKVSVRNVEKAFAKHQLNMVPPSAIESPPTAGPLIGEDCPAPQLVLSAGFSLQPDTTTQSTADLKRFSQLSTPRQALVRLFQSVNYGEILGVAIQNGDPIFHPEPTVLVDVKLDAEEADRPEEGLQDFELRDEVRRLLAHLDKLKSGKIERIEVRAGIPRRFTIERSLTGEPR